MNHKVVAILFFCSLAQHLHAQRYGTTIGARWGGARYGVSLQQRIAGNSTIEGIALLGSQETVLTAMYENHRPIIFKWKGFNTYIGGGAHFGWYHTDTLQDRFSGLDGIMGIEYKLPLLPFAGSFDFKPTYNFSHANEKRQFQPQFAVSLRYVLITYREQEKRKRKRERERNKKENEGKGLFDIFDKTDKNEKQDRNKKQDKEKSFWDKINIFKKKDDN